MTTIRFLLAVASAKKWNLHQLDVNNAFLHGDLKDNVYMSIPDGLVVSGSQKVCKLQKSLYGLKQASRKWFEKLTTLLLHNGYTQSHADSTLLTKKDGEHFIALCIYVD